MAIRITDYELNCNTHSLYKVDFYDHYIKTLVTHTPSRVRSWINKIKYMHRYRLGKLIIGLDVEWRPNYTRNTNNKVATLQLCVGHNCLIFQLLYAPGNRIPKRLVDFLGDPNFTFLGVGIQDDIRKLWNDHGLVVAKFADLRDLKAKSFGGSVPRNIGLKDMALEVLGQEFQKPHTITTSYWDNPDLSLYQITYACIDAFVSFEIGRVLRAADYVEVY